MSFARASLAVMTFVTMLAPAAAHAVVIPTSADASTTVRATIEIEGGTLSATVAGMDNASTATRGLGPHSVMANASASLISSIDTGCITPTAGCAVDYRLAVMAETQDGIAEAYADISQTSFQVVVETSAELLITLVELVVTTNTVLGNGSGPFAEANAPYPVFLLDGNPLLDTQTLPTGVESASIMLDAGEYVLTILPLSANAYAEQILEVSAPLSLSLLGFGLVALGGGVRNRRRLAL